MADHKTTRNAGVSGFLSRFARARKGGVAMMFALALPPLTLVAVCGVDIHRQTSVRNSLQDAVDAAALAAARSPQTTDAGVRSVGMQALRANLANFPDVALREEAVSTNFEIDDEGAVQARARADVATIVAGAFLGRQLEVNVDTTVYRSNNRVEVALVIDNTGSMASDGKLAAAQAAATTLVERLAAADARSIDEDAVRISLVPFSQTVRPVSGFTSSGTSSNRNAASALGWVSRANLHTGSSLFETSGASLGADRFALLDQMRIGWGGCVEGRPYPYDVQDTPPSTSNQSTMFVPYFSPDDPDQSDYPNESTWRGWFNSGWTNNNNYLNDMETGSSSSNPFGSSSVRNATWNTRLRNVAKYQQSRLLSGVTISPNYQGPNRGCTIQPVIRLTEDYDAVTDTIANMVASGNTNIPMGLMWGWHTLSPNAPFADGRPYGEERLTKIIILLTDGDNVNSESNVPDDSIYSGLGLIWQGRLGAGVGIGSSGSQRRDVMDDRLEELCENLRSNEIILYTVGVRVDSRTQTLLRNCATNDDMFYNVTNTSGIESAFDRIAGSIENLRIAN